MLYPSKGYIGIKFIIAKAKFIVYTIGMFLNIYARNIFANGPARKIINHFTPSLL